MKDETVVTVINKSEDSGSGRAKKDACLVVIYGAELGRKYTIAGVELTIGRATSNDICVSQDSVSRTHATLGLDDSGVRIKDNESTNGTYVNDHKIHEAWLKDGDLIKVGRSIFKFLTGDNIESSYHEEIYRLSTVDGLTEIFNKRYFLETIDRELSRARRYDRPLALLMFDIDHFKVCNDTFGHRAGDYVLREIASIVRERARKVDVLARYGGEEFSLILPEVETKGAAIFGEKIRSMIEQARFVFEGHHIPITISVGVAELTPSIANADDLIKASDANLYRAKNAGRNCVVSS